jgi:uncharacterized OB-fold protein
MTTLRELKTPGPTAVALTAPFWKAAAEGRLTIQRCRSCGTAVFYPRAICPACWSDRLAWEEASGKGVLASFSEVWRPGHPGWLPAVPYCVGLVRLAEGPTMLSHILAAGARPRVGDALILEPTDIGGRVLPAFRLDRT